ncbi:unnamed protein product [Enterobius vermicularis]|uniref:TPX2_importin domain-containing protein n=1 Tax=Enterobius vermicularis TaxID=51028 RepID=A0A0N4VAQ8_ENTVE|nr:unnamed protein product [Enterobius vermicularis]
MTEEDVYEIDSVPRFANFGDNGQLANDTMGDKFFESTASPGGRGGNDQVGSDGSNSNRASSKPMTEINNTDMPKKVMADPEDDDPLGIRKLAMFRPPRRSRDLIRMAQQKAKENMEAKTDIQKNADKHESGCLVRKLVVGNKFIRPRSASVDAAQVRGRIGATPGSYANAEFKTGIPVVRRGSIDVSRAPVKSRSEEKNGQLCIPRTSRTVPTRTHHRSASVDSAASRIKMTPVDVNNRGLVASKARLATGPKGSITRRAGPVSAVPPVVSVPSNSKGKTSQSSKHTECAVDKSIRRSILQVPSRSRPLTRAFAARVEALRLKREDLVPGDNPSSSKPETSREAYKLTGRIASVCSEAQFRNAVRRRPAGGDSLERPIKSDKEPEMATEKAVAPLSNKNARRSTVTQHYVHRPSQATIPSKMATSTRQHPSPHTTGARPRLMPAEREAFFRRLSTPKCINNLKKPEGETPKKTSKVSTTGQNRDVPLGGLKARVLRPRTTVIKGAVKVKD